MVFLDKSCIILDIFLPIQTTNTYFRMLANIANCLAEIYIGIRTKNDTTLQGSFPLFFAKKIRKKKVLKAQKRAQSLLKWRIEFRRSELYDKKLACHQKKGSLFFM